MLSIHDYLWIRNQSLDPLTLWTSSNFNFRMWEILTSKSIRKEHTNIESVKTNNENAFFEKDVMNHFILERNLLIIDILKIQKTYIGWSWIKDLTSNHIVPKNEIRFCLNLLLKKNSNHVFQGNELKHVLRIYIIFIIVYCIW
jgi:hypothetical protein